MKRMSRNSSQVAKLNLTSLVDVFTILVFFLLVHFGSPEVLETPKEVELPKSVVESKPRETVVIFIGKEEVVVQGEPVVSVAAIETAGEGDIVPIIDRLVSLTDSVIGPSTQVVAESKEVTILADRSVPFNVIKRVMSTCTSGGYDRISLAVMTKDPAPGATATPPQVAQI
jgi:biopolymer transport protein ExbD